MPEQVIYNKKEFSELITDSIRDASLTYNVSTSSEYRQVDNLRSVLGKLRDVIDHSSFSETDKKSLYKDYETALNTRIQAETIKSIDRFSERIKQKTKLQIRSLDHSALYSNEELLRIIKEEEEKNRISSTFGLTKEFLQNSNKYLKNTALSTEERVELLSLACVGAILIIAGVMIGTGGIGVVAAVAVLMIECGAIAALVGGGVLIGDSIHRGDKQEVQQKASKELSALSRMPELPPDTKKSLEEIKETFDERMSQKHHHSDDQGKNVHRNNRNQNRHLT